MYGWMGEWMDGWMDGCTWVSVYLRCKSRRKKSNTVQTNILYVSMVFFLLTHVKLAGLVAIAAFAPVASSSARQMVAREREARRMKSLLLVCYIHTSKHMMMRCCIDSCRLIPFVYSQLRERQQKVGKQEKQVVLLSGAFLSFFSSPGHLLCHENEQSELAQF